MTTFTWTIASTSGTTATSDIISFALTGVDGVTPDISAAPVFVYYGLRSGLAELPPPPIYHIGEGVYVAEVSAAHAAAGIVWSVNTGSYPSRYTGAISSTNDPLFAFHLEGDYGALWTGAAPTFSLYANPDGSPRPSMPALVKGARVGVYAFTGSAADMSAGTVFLVTAPSPAAPAYVQGNMLRPLSLGFTATQTTLYQVDLETTQPLLALPELSVPANYTLAPADPLVVVPTVTTVQQVAANRVRLTLSVELVTGTYAVSVAAGTWYSPGTFTTNTTDSQPLYAVGNPPVLQAAYQHTASSVRLKYSKKMRHANAGVASDALRPANYAIPGETVSGVTAVTDQLFELAVTPALGVGPYSLTVGGSRDLAGNPVAAATVSLPFGETPGVVSDPGNVIGNTVLVPAEWRLRSPFKYPTLEFFRQTMLQNVSGSQYTGSRGRALLFFTQDTDIRAVFVNLFGVTFNTPTPALVLKKTALEVHTAVSSQLDRLVPLALAELRQAQVPEVFTYVVERRLLAHNYVDKVSAYAAVVLLAAAVLE